MRMSAPRQKPGTGNEKQRKKRDKSAAAAARREQEVDAAAEERAIEEMDLQLALEESKEYQRAIALSKEIVDLS